MDVNCRQYGSAKPRRESYGAAVRVVSATTVVTVLAVVLFGSSEVRAGDAPARIAFAADVVPILTKLGCNSGGCHGKSTGQNGFKLSLLGFVPAFDHESLVKEARGRRVFAGDPDSSLLLQKAIGRVPHGGGRRLGIGSPDYRVLAWYRTAVPGRDGADPAVMINTPAILSGRYGKGRVLVSSGHSRGELVCDVE